MKLDDNIINLHYIFSKKKTNQNCTNNAEVLKLCKSDNMKVSEIIFTKSVFRATFASFVYY